MTRIIMVRHGQSVANESKKFAGHSDFDLTDLGRRQAALAAKYLAERERVDYIYASDLRRAHNTALPFSEAYGLDITDRVGLRELFAGAWEGMTIDDITLMYGEDMRIWREDFASARCTGGESVAELYARVVPEVCELARRHDGKTLLIATHATPIRAVECFSRGIGAAGMGEVNFVKNASLNIFEFDPSTGAITPVEINILDHLGTDEVTKGASEFEKRPETSTSKGE